MFSKFPHVLQITIRREEANAKNKLLSTVAAGGVEQIANLSQKWSKFELMMESFQLMINGQVRSML